MTDVLFITPTASKNAFDESLGTLILTTILREKGVQADILSFHRIGDTADFAAFLTSAQEKITAAKPKIVSFYTRCDCYHIMLKIAEAVKENLGCYIVFAGPQADITAKETIAEIPYVDFVCCGEGETTVYPFFSSLLRGEPDLTVRGLVYRGEAGVTVNPRPDLIADLDNSPLVDYSLFGENAVYDTSEPFPIDVGRGCPFGCTYCSTNNFWGRKYRLKSPGRIVEEIKHYHDRYGVEYFAFEHDMFTMNKKQVTETCRLMRELDFPVKWKCSARIDCIDKDLIDTMTDAGLKQLYIGIETGSPRMQKLINKNLKLDGVLDMLSYITSKNLNVIVSFIYGFPEETEQDVSQTLSLITDILNLKRVTVQTHLCTFLPGTELSQRYKDELVPAETFSDITGTAAIAECADLIEAHPNLFWHFSEYKTELRERLSYFTHFVRFFKLMLPVYRHYMNHYYTKDNLFRMYCDFVAVNGDNLQGEDKTSEKLLRILKNDGMLKEFAKDPCADMLADAYRLRNARLSVVENRVSSAMEITCISPIDLERCENLADCPRGLYMVTYTKDANGALQISVRRT